MLAAADAAATPSRTLVVVGHGADAGDRAPRRGGAGRRARAPGRAERHRARGPRSRWRRRRRARRHRRGAQRRRAAAARRDAGAPWSRRTRRPAPAATVLTAEVADPSGLGRIVRDRGRRAGADRRGARRHRRAAGDPRDQRRASTRSTRSLLRAGARQAVDRQRPGRGVPHRRVRRCSVDAGRARWPCTWPPTRPRRSAATTGSSWPALRALLRDRVNARLDARRRDDPRPGDDLDRRDRDAGAGRGRSSRTRSCAARPRSAAGAVVGPDTTLIDTAVGAGATRACARTRSAPRSAASATVGPYAYLRPGTVLGTAGEGRHVRRDQERRARRRAPRSRTCRTWATPRSARRPTSARARSSSTTTASTSTTRPSVTPRSWAATRC